LLREDGSLFVSIDDNEMPSLRLLLNQIFGETNHIATCVWQKRYSRENREAIGDVHEYILVYAMDAERFKATRNRIPLDEDQAKVYRNPENAKETDPAKRWRGLPMTAQGFRPNQMYTIVAPNGKKHKPPEGRCWGMIEPEFQKLKDSNRIYWGKGGNAQPSVIRFLSEVEGLVPWTWWTHEEVGHTDEARKEIQSIFTTQTAFDTPKPVRLLDRILQIATAPGDIVLDFFAGSGTTAHSVLKANKADGGDRRFIMVSSTEATAETPDKNLCRDVCAERIRRVIHGYSDDGSKVEGLGGNFAYLRCRKISPARLLDIEHSEVWAALQLLHRPRLLANPDKLPAFLISEDDSMALIYVPRFDSKCVPALRESVKNHASVVIYSWQPGLLRQHIRAAHVQFEAIPESLVRRFGLSLNLNLQETSK
jgi:adenine-specific DNA-methyltransferase